MIPKKFETNAVRTQAEKSQHDEHSVPLYLTSSFVFDDAEEMRASFADEKQRNIYSRFTNPNTNEFVDKIVYEDSFTISRCLYNITALRENFID